MSHHTGEHPTANEDEYFVRQNAELIKTMRAQLDAERRVRERHSHFMKCPKCGGDLRETPHGQVTVDFCPECGGVWLDAGEVALIRAASRNPLFDLVTDLFDLLGHTR